MTTATTTTITSASTAWMTLPMTWPASTEARAIAIVRKRAMIPSVMSIATEIAVPWRGAGHRHQQDPGHRRRRGTLVPRPPADRARAPSPAPSVPPNTNTNRSRKDDREAGDEEREGRVAPHPAEAAPEHRRASR